MSWGETQSCGLCGYQKYRQKQETRSRGKIQSPGEAAENRDSEAGQNQRKQWKMHSLNTWLRRQCKEKGFKPVRTWNAS